MLLDDFRCIDKAVGERVPGCAPRYGPRTFLLLLCYPERRARAKRAQVTSIFIKLTALRDSLRGFLQSVLLTVLYALVFAFFFFYVCRFCSMAGVGVGGGKEACMAAVIGEGRQSYSPREGFVRPFFFSLFFLFFFLFFSFSRGLRDNDWRLGFCSDRWRMVTISMPVIRFVVECMRRVLCG